MKFTMGRLAAVSLVALAGAGIAVTGSAQPGPSKGGKIENSYICVFQPGLVSKGNVRAEANRAAQAAGGNVKHAYSHSIRGFAVNASAQGVARMQANNPRIAFCEQDAEASISQGRGKPGGNGGTSPQQTPYGITRVNGGISGASGTAWIIDTGIDLDHPDLNVDVARSANFSREKDANDNNGHGTHVAGTVAAIDDANGVIGVAAGATVVAVKTLDRNGRGSCSDIIAGVDYVAQVGQPGDVANMSLGCPVIEALDQAVIAASKDVKFALAAGNERQNIANVSPARAQGPNIYTISASDSSDRWASFSNFGDGVDFAEPGVSVFSTYKDGGYASLSGTSMAAPHAAGLLLLGPIRADGTVIGDPDGVADPIGVR